MRLPPAALAVAVLAAAGCGSQPYSASLTYPLRTDRLVAKLPEAPPDGLPEAGKFDEFVAGLDARGGKTYDPANLSDDAKAKLRQALDDAFGTPAAPKVHCDDAEAQALADGLNLRPDVLAEGSKFYKAHCLQCHGLTGDGRGPTGAWVYPLPRDLRQGIFKFVSSAGSAARKPARADLHRMLRVGIDRTSMPAFPLLSEGDRERLVAYTIHLSLRGEAEFRVMLALLADADDADEEINKAVQAKLKRALAQWAQADAEVITPASLPTPDDPDQRVTPAHLDSVRRGYDLFRAETTGCIACHTDYGRQERFLYDAWGGVTRATNLTEGSFRGGKTPLDLFHRVRGGVGPSGMPAATSLSEAQAWDLVHFVQALPNPKMLPADVRRQIYPGAR
jgi:mono/diheme cytochrome c family protein